MTRKSNPTKRKAEVNPYDVFAHDMTANMLFFAKTYSELSGRNSLDFDESDIDAALAMRGGNGMPVSWLYEVRKSPEPKRKNKETTNG